MDRDLENQTYVQLVLGTQAVVSYLGGPALDTDEALESVLDKGEVLRAQPEARTASFFLEAISEYGIEVTAPGEGSKERFIPWGAVLAIYGDTRENLLHQIREAAKEEQAE
jgi:hypothetical protein